LRYTDFPVIVQILLDVLLQDKLLRKGLTPSQGITLALVVGTWEWVRLGQYWHFRGTIIGNVLFVVSDLMKYNDLQAVETMALIVTECDFLSVIAFLMFEVARSSKTEPEMFPFIKWVLIHRLLSRCHLASFQSALRPLFLHVLDRLRTIETNGENDRDPGQMIRVWEGFGTIAGFSEAQLRAEAATERRKATGDAEGCCWFKCVMYRRSHQDLVMFRCTGCQKSVYCSLACQERDWQRGNHRATCEQPLFVAGQDEPGRLLP